MRLRPALAELMTQWGYLSPVIPRIDQGWDVGAQGAEDAQRGLSPEKGNT